MVPTEYYIYSSYICHLHECLQAIWIKQMPDLEKEEDSRTKLQQNLFSENQNKEWIWTCREGRAGNNICKENNCILRLLQKEIQKKMDPDIKKINGRNPIKSYRKNMAEVHQNGNTKSNEWWEAKEKNKTMKVSEADKMKIITKVN